MSKKIAVVLMCVILCIAAVSCSSAATGTPVQYDSLPALSKAVEFEVVPPTVAPEGYALAGYYAVDGKLAQIVYISGTSELIYAMTKMKKIECGLEKFDETKTADINGVAFEMNMIGGSVHLAFARVGEFSYGLYSKDGLTEEKMTEMATGLELK